MKKPVNGNGGVSMRTLWRAKLIVGGTRKDEFLFRESDDFQVAAVTADKLLAGSTAAEMSGATIVAVEKMAHLWN